MGHSLAGGAEAFVHLAGVVCSGDGEHLLSKSRGTSDLTNKKVKTGRKSFNKDPKLDIDFLSIIQLTPRLIR